MTPALYDALEAIADNRARYRAKVTILFLAAAALVGAVCALAPWDAPISFFAQCQNVPGGDVCQITWEGE